MRDGKYTLWYHPNPSFTYIIQEKQVENKLKSVKNQSFIIAFAMF